jgi:tetratricopeptide (TPR) repeat protein
VFWVRADSQERLRADLSTIAALVGLPEAKGQKQDQQRLIAALIHWLGMRTQWLLVLDNVEDEVDISDLLSTAGDGHILLTTRSQAIADLGYNVQLHSLAPQEGALLLLRRAHLLSIQAPLDAASPQEQEIAREISRVLDGLPLALDLAGAYIREHSCSLPGYLERYYAYRRRLLQWKSQQKLPFSDYPHSVATTWLLSFERVEQECPAAANFLRLCASLDLDGIPEEVMLENPAELGASTSPIAQNVLEIDSALEVLLRYSLIQRNHTSGTLTVHRLVQAVMRDRMTAKEQRYWADRAVRAVHHAFFSARFATLQQYDRYLAHVTVCAHLIAQWDLQTEAAAHLLFLAGSNLQERGRYVQAEPLCLQALQLYEKLFGPNHATVAGSLALLATLYMEQREYTLSEPLERRFDSIILEQAHKGGTFDTPTILHNLARRYIEQGKFDLALLFSERALHHYEQNPALDPVGRAFVCQTLARLYMTQRDYTRAESVCQLQRRIYEHLPAPDCYRVTESLRSLAHIAMQRGQLMQAEQLVRQAQEMDMQVLEVDHPDIARDMELLAILAEKQARYSEAERLLRQTLAMRQRRLGPNAYAVAVNLGNLAVVLSKQERDEQATFFYQQAEELFEHRKGFEAHSYVNFLRSYAVHLKKIGRVDEALQRMHLVVLIEEQSAEKYGDLLQSDEGIRDQDA